MTELKDKAAYGMVGAVIAGIINLGIFAMKSDIADLETRVYKNFVQKEELSDINQRFDTIDKKIDKVLDLILKQPRA